MPGFTFDVASASLSLAYDGITIYPKKPSNASAPSYSIQMVLTACFQIAFIKVPVTDPAITSCAGEIRKKALFERNVYADDNDHFLYHGGDEYDMGETHFHLKFSRYLRQEDIAELADVLEQQNVFTAAECAQFKQELAKRYATIHATLDTHFNRNKEHDLTAINRFVATCTDNDVLADLHQYLVSAKFNYLRECTGLFKKTRWQGTLADGSIAKTSKTWAMIEKGITLQMAANVRNNIKATPEVILEQAVEFAASHPFFSLPRRSKGERAISRTFAAVSDNAKEPFEARYIEHFTKYTK
jgi:hypothetical protein